MRTLAVILPFVVVSSLAAQPLTVGTGIAETIAFSTISSGAPVSFVNLNNAAIAAGTVNKASVQWSNTCTGAFKIVFLRNNFSSASAFTVVATRGPFDAVAGRNDVTLTPPVTLASGDLIGVVQLQPAAACGSVMVQTYPRDTGYRLITTTDISTAGTLGATSNYAPGSVFGAIAYANDPLLVRVVPAAGAVQGTTAFFRTSLQLQNPSSSTITGRLVFHPAGQSGSASDPSLAFTLNSTQVLSYPDVVAAMGVSGLGSLDVLTNGGALPIVTARVFSDGGSAGTSGFTEDGLSPADTLNLFIRGVLLIPPDLTNFRMNVGVRTLDAGATLSINMYSANGALRSTRTGVSYPPNYFEQATVSQFTGAATVEPGGWILIKVDAFPGTAFVYGTVIDNRTSDSSFRIAAVK